MDSIKTVLVAQHAYEISKIVLHSDNGALVDIYVRNARAIRRTLYNSLGLIDSDEMEAMQKALVKAYTKTRQCLAGRNLEEITGH